MIKIVSPLALCFAMLFINSCKKNNTINNCFPTSVTSRKIVKQPAVIRKQPNGSFLIIEQGTIDTQLNPCKLKAEFQVDNLQVMISGDVKSLSGTVTGPCCVYDFIITSISRQ